MKEEGHGSRRKRGNRNQPKNPLHEQPDKGKTADMSQRNSAAHASQASKTHLNDRLSTVGNNYNPAANNQPSINDIVEQLHPMRMYPWQKIFPVIEHFDYTKIKGLGSPTKKQSKQQKAYAEFEDERVPNSARTDVPAEVSPAEDTRSLWQKISDFQDPMKELAVGLSSYHQQLVHLFVLFLLLLLLHIPFYAVYNSYSFYKGTSALSGLSLGNLGSSETHCAIESVAMAQDQYQVPLTCNRGRVTDLVDFGITTKFEDQHSCSKFAQTQYCQQFLDFDSIYDFFQKECRNKERCFVGSLPDFVLPDTDTSQISMCFQEDSRLYVQYKCEETSVDVDQKTQSVEPLVFIEVLCVALVVACLKFNFNKTRKLEQEYGMNKVSADQYSLFVKVHDAKRREFNARFDNPDMTGMTRGERVVKFIDRQLQFCPSNFVRIDLVYANRKLIQLLKRRGQAIKNQQENRVDQLTMQIESIKHQIYNTDVIGAYVIFEKQLDR